MKSFSFCTRLVGGFSLTALGVFCLVMTADAAPVKDPYHPQVNGSPITLMKDNMLTQALGGRMVDLDVWAGEFIKYDDNIFNTKNNKKPDTILSTAAGFKMDAKQPEVWSLKLEGQVQYNAYTDHTKYSGLEGYFHSKGTIDFSPALSARLALNYDNTYDNMRNVEDIYALHQYSASTGVTIKPSPYAGIDVDYTYFGQRRDVKRMNYQNYNEHTIALRPYYDVTPNTTLYMQFAGGQAKPTEDVYNTSQSFSSLFGVAWKYQDAAKLFAEVGYKYMHFDDNGAILDTSRHVSRPTFRAGGEYAVTTDWKTGVDVSYAPAYGAVTSNASNSNYIDRLIAGAFLTYSPGEGRFTCKLSPYMSFNRPSENDEYKEYGMLLGVSYSFTDWFNVSAGYRYSVTDYEHQSSYDRNSVTVGFALTF